MLLKLIPANMFQQKQKQLDQKEKLKEMATKTKVFAQQLRSMPEFTAVFR